MDIELSTHTKDMLRERKIPEEWVWLTINKPDWKNIEKIIISIISKVSQSTVKEFFM